MVNKDHEPRRRGYSRSSVSRRKLMGLTGAVVGTSALSGCLGDDDDEAPDGIEDSDDDDAPDEVEEDDGDDAPDEAEDEAEDDEEGDLDFGASDGPREISMVSYATVADMHYNYFNPANNACFGDWFGGDFLYEKPAVYYPSREEFQGYLLDDWTIDGTTFTGEVAEGYMWHNGDDVTAEDFVFQWELLLWRDHEEGHTMVADVEQVDDYTYELELHEEQNELLTELELLNQDESILAAHPEHHQDYYERFEDATTDDEMDEIVSDLMSDRVEEPIGNGILELTDRPEALIVLEKFDDHPEADGHDLERVRVDQTLQERANFHGEYPNIHVWGYGGCARHEELDDIWDPAEAGPVFSPSQEYLAVDLDHEFLGRRHVRLGLQELIDPQMMVEFTNLCAWEYDGIPSGLDETTQETFVDSIDQFDEYGPYNVDAATEHFREAGLEEDGDMWVNEDGEPFEFDILINDHASGHHGMAEVLRTQGQEAGFEVEIRIVEDTVHAQRQVDGDFEATPYVHGMDHPYLTFNELFNGSLQHQIGLPDENEITPVGDPDGETETINTAESASSLRTMEGDDLHENVEELAWWFNQNVPMITLYDQGAGNWFFRTDLWDWRGERTGDGAPDDLVEVNSLYTVTRNGYFTWDPVDPSELEHGHDHMIRDFHQ